MGTEILRPNDCLILPVPSLHHHRWRHPDPNPNSKPHPKPFKKRRSRQPKSPKTGGGCSFSLGQVRILKRGDSANPLSSSSTIVSIESLISDHLGPDSDLVAYAGSAITTSPSPRSLPLPSFSGMKAEEPAAGLVGHSTGTEDLRRLLRLD